MVTWNWQALLRTMTCWHKPRTLRKRQSTLCLTMIPQSIGKPKARQPQPARLPL